MKKSTLSKFFLFCGLFLMLSEARAQYVAIPDTVFGDILHSIYPTCMSGNHSVGWQLDTTCNAILANNQYLALGYSHLKNIEGIQYFKNLNELDCDNNYLTSLSVLPASLRVLHCQNNQIASISALPLQLTYLECSFNQLTSLPPLNSSLQFLFCTANQLITIPTLPSSLQKLYCYANQITSLPSLPSSLQEFDCSNNHISNLPILDTSLTLLGCASNQLTTIPTLPRSLRFFYCDQNSLLLQWPILPDSLYSFSCTQMQLTSLPILPRSLHDFTCSNSQFTSLPALPGSLSSLDCSVNQLTSLPMLPASLVQLNCSNNNLTSLPNLPDSLDYFYCYNNPGLYCLPQVNRTIMNTIWMSNTGIQCVPNHFNAINYDFNPDTLPLCTPKSGCNFYYSIVGHAHSDTSNNCVTDAIHPSSGLSNLKVRLMQNGNLVQQLYTTSSGFYSFHTDSFLTYEVEIDTANFFSLECPVARSYSISLSPADSINWNVNFGLKCSVGDYQANYIVSPFIHPFRNNILTPVSIGIDNLALHYNATCADNLGGIVTVIYSGAVHYVSPVSGAIMPSAILGDTLMYVINDLDSLQAGSIAMLFLTDTNAYAGSPVCITAIVSPSTTDVNPQNDTVKQCFEVHNSHDPNLKEVYPFSSIDTGAAQWLTYTVHFQNTGNDTAYTVIVKDTLSQNVDASSFQYLASSHHAVIQLFGNAMVFTFPKINLVDSATNPPLSEGWIQYKVKTKPNLPLGTQIKNTASIYFDLNPAIVTNTTVNTVQIDTTHTHVGISPQTHEEGLIQVYPNPATQSCTIAVSNMNGIFSAQLLDISGREVSNLGVLKSGGQTFSVSSFAKGIYMLRISDSQGQSLIRKLVIE